MENKAIEIADKMAQFLQPAPSDDEGLIRAAMEWTLQVSPRQLFGLSNMYSLAADPLVPVTVREQLLKRADLYLKLKRHHDSGAIMGDFIESLSWRKFVRTGAVTGAVNKNSQQ